MDSREGGGWGWGQVCSRDSHLDHVPHSLAPGLTLELSQRLPELFQYQRLLLQLRPGYQPVVMGHIPLDLLHRLLQVTAATERPSQPLWPQPSLLKLGS